MLGCDLGGKGEGGGGDCCQDQGVLPASKGGGSCCRLAKGE